MLNFLPFLHFLAILHKKCILWRWSKYTTYFLRLDYNEFSRMTLNCFGSINEMDTCAQSTCLGKQLCKACQGLLERAWAGHHIQTSADSKKIQIFTSDAIGAAWHRMTFWPIPPSSIRLLFKFLPLYFLVAYFILLKLCY